MRLFPREETYGLGSQLRSAAISIPSNISEGHQQPTKVYLRFVGIAAGSAAEAETQLEIARRLNCAKQTELQEALELVADLRRVIFGLRRALRKRRTTERTVP